MERERITFNDIARLISNTPSTTIDLPASGKKKDESRWEFFAGYHKVHVSTYPFRVLYLHSDATKSDLQTLAEEIEEELDFDKLYVVYPPSLNQRHSAHIDLFKGKTKGFWTTKEFLRTFIDEELHAYIVRIDELTPTYYIDPRIKTESEAQVSDTNPLLSLLLDEENGPRPDEGALGIVLAEPGQGKTYLSRHLVTEIPRLRKDLVPIIVDSSQWNAMSLAHLKSIWKTIVHSFHHFDAPINWIAGNENDFIRATLKADLFRIVFDGFDEYILRNRGSVQPMDVLMALSDLARETGARILLTSRTSFWRIILSGDEVKSFMDRTGSIEYRILPFDLAHARDYFERRLQQPKRVNAAVKIFNTIHQNNPELAGRGFVLHLIAALAEGDEPIRVTKGAHGLLWLMEALCERDVLRHELPLTPDQQLSVMQHFAYDAAQGTEPSRLLLEVCIHTVRPDLDENTMDETIEKLKNHPLLFRNPHNDLWGFSQEQIEIALLAKHMIDLDDHDLYNFVNQLEIEAGPRQDLIAMIIDLVMKKPQEQALEKIDQLIDAMSIVPETGPETQRYAHQFPYKGRLFAATLALMAVGRVYPLGAIRLDRTKLLVRLSTGHSIKHLYFFGPIGRFDFRDITFEDCRFEHVTWGNCMFDTATKFIRCQFIGGTPPVRCEGFGSAQFINCTLDRVAKAWINTARIREGYKNYTREDLRNDLHYVLIKFIHGQGLSLKQVPESDLHRDPITASKYMKDIIGVLSETTLELKEDPTSETAEKVYIVRSKAEVAFKFYGANNNLTGPLKKAYSALLKRRKL